MTGGHSPYTGREPYVHRLRALRSGGVYLLLALLAACAEPPETGGYRDQSVPIGVSSRFAPERFEGVWQVRGAYPVDADLETVARRSAGPDASVWTVRSQVCPAGASCRVETTEWPATVTQPGVDRVDTPEAKARQVVVIWVDEGFRTAAVGDPAGSFAWVLDRNTQGGADRIEAARQVLAFNGFDVSAMEMRP